MIRKLRISGILLILGLVIEALSLFWNTAISFMSFAVFGGMFFAAGILLFLYSLVPSRISSNNN
jgi:ABC-type antimicrobial peptide transport system permease subunit